MKQVKVYGPGCKRCETTKNMVQDAATKLNIEVEIEKITDPREIAVAGIMSTPGISVDGKLVHAGGLPDEAKLESWLLS
ncbi:thioredoxin family protein [Pseudovibrio sp. Tun.PSC04-5.I4]|uniref:thioredoxin family protein n=1 Tax=Pseudovibrio sp. Tun.PSC04-5.I4 TaxID=1798213 RepID=UPI00087E0F70|nr:thioredoxin family protein [Pseudovibrio sp. Tun.PSC04-5.I4]SDR48659.1 small redox-active disulfide protein 2 [Pseudovibrio sp. Tun.PSC04-5.I4]